jgi:outer membrane protein OmpA-like peptidoglycan-associated protein
VAFGFLTHLQPLPLRAASISATPATGLGSLPFLSRKIDSLHGLFLLHSDLIRNESQPRIKEIAEVLRCHGDWKLPIAGHTVGAGGDRQNLDLSKTTVVAIKDALVTEYGTTANRLKRGLRREDTNDTLEGCAHDRRVERMKISKNRIPGGGKP